MEVASSIKCKRLLDLIESDNPDLDELRGLTWSGLPANCSWRHRALTWQLLAGYIPREEARRIEVRDEKRRIYQRTTDTYFNTFVGFNSLEGIDQLSSLSPETVDSTAPTNSYGHHLDLGQLRQIRADLSRTKPQGFRQIFSCPKIQFVLTRALYVYAIKNPGSGYVQGINDILVPLFLVCLHSEENGTEPMDIQKVVNDTILKAEADSYFLLQMILSEIQDNYTNGQPGITQQLKVIKTIMGRMKPELIEHFNAIGLDINQFAFRWMNCLMSREFDTLCLIRLWDTFISEGAKNLRKFMIFLGSVYLMRLSSTLLRSNFQDAMIFIQSPPSTRWGQSDMETLVAEVYILKSLFEDSPKQLQLAD